MRLLEAENHPRMAWKNGGGETVEIAVHPAGAGLADFDWRVSMANVAVDGPFSVFPGIDRTLAILDGAGLDLEIEGRGRHALTAASRPLRFPADAPTAARLAGGPVTDLNVMTRRGAFAHRLRRPGGSGAFEARGRWIVLLAAAPCSILVNGREARLDRFDAIHLEGEATVASGDGDDGLPGLFVVEIDADS